MTKSSRRLLGLLTFGVLAGGWLYAASLLWRTAVPSNLKLPHVDMSALVSASELHRAQHFSFVLDLFGILGLLLPLVVLALYAKWGHRFMGESAAGPIGTGMLLAMLGLAILWMATLPSNIGELWWLRRYGIEKVGYAEMVINTWFVLGSEFLGICLTILIVMGFARLLGNRWWLAGAPAFVGIALLVTFVQPYMSGLQPLKDHTALVQAEKRLAKKDGLGNIPLKVENVGTQTTAPNAESMGLGPSRRIAIWSTMLDGRFSEPELEFVIAHELGHQKHNDLWKGIGWFALFSFPIAYLIAWLTRRRGGMVNPLAVPLFLFLWVAFPTLTLPLDNAFSRRIEAAADWQALQSTHDPQAGKALFLNFVRTTDEDPNPPAWDPILFGNHPTEAQRIAMVDAWQKRYGH
ncbi:MAG: M48 family metalloprotease [Gaiellaceae bacterium]